MADNAAPVTPEVEDFKQHLRNMLVGLKVTHVVLVDDLADAEIGVAQVLEALLGDERARGALQPHFPDIDLDPLSDALPPLLEKEIAARGAKGLARLGAALAPFGGASAEIHDVHQLRQLIAEDLTVEILSPRHWAERRAALLDRCDPEARTLFLFDQELGVEGQGLGFEKGTDIIRQMSLDFPDDFGARWFCGILSHTLEKGQEVARWRELEHEANVGLRFFMPISKENLRSEADFFDAVYRTLLNSYCEVVKAFAITALTDSLQEASGRFKNLDPIEFEHMVVNSTGGEGASELGTMLRLFAIIQGNQTKREILKEGKFAGFAAATSAMKTVADYRRQLSEAGKGRMAALRHEELYEAPDLINTFRDPLRNGDLFELTTDKPEQWVLIVQPCDVMVRGNGKRNRENTFKVAVLAPVQPLHGEEDAESTGETTYVLPGLFDNGKTAGLVEFAKASVAQLDILDLTVLSNDGKCEYAVGANPAEHDVFFSRGWQQRYRTLADKFDSIGRKIEEERKKFQGAEELILQARLPRIGPGQKFRNRGEFKGGTFSYPIRRLGRVRDAQSGPLLAAFGRYLSREAFAHDFSGAKAGED